jgi:hypothetical protein
MTRVAEKIDAHLGERFAMELNREFERGCCEACRIRFDGPCPKDTDAPEKDAEQLMLRAAQTKKCVPARDRWRLEPELKKNLAALYLLYQSGMIGPCSGARRVSKPATVTVTLVSAEVRLWWELTADAVFIDRLHQAFDLRREQITFARFRSLVLATCNERGVTGVNEALEVLKEHEEALAIDRFN